MSKLSLLALVLVCAAPAWSQQPANPTSGANRPGGTTAIAPTPGPATSPALPSPTLPPAAVENREKAQAAKTERKAQKKSKKAAKKPVKPASRPQTGSAGPSSTSPGAPAPAR